MATLSRTRKMQVDIASTLHPVQDISFKLLVRFAWSAERHKSYCVYFSFFRKGAVPAELEIHGSAGASPSHSNTVRLWLTVKRPNWLSKLQLVAAGPIWP